ncbi:hypothetical protein DFJ73DRAFT_854952, partial [Zopfochytrium polystomum]
AADHGDELFPDPHLHLPPFGASDAARSTRRPHHTSLFQTNSSHGGAPSSSSSSSSTSASPHPRHQTHPSSRQPPLLRVKLPLQAMKSTALAATPAEPAASDPGIRPSSLSVSFSGRLRPLTNSSIPQPAPQQRNSEDPPRANEDESHQLRDDHPERPDLGRAVVFFSASKTLWEWRETPSMRLRRAATLLGAEGSVVGGVEEQESEMEIDVSNNNAIFEDARKRGLEYAEFPFEIRIPANLPPTMPLAGRSPVGHSHVRSDPLLAMALSLPAPVLQTLSFTSELVAGLAILHTGTKPVMAIPTFPRSWFQLEPKTLHQGTVAPDFDYQIRAPQLLYRQHSSLLDASFAHDKGLRKSSNVLTFHISLTSLRSREFNLRSISVMLVRRLRHETQSPQVTPYVPVSAGGPARLDIVCNGALTLQSVLIQAPLGFCDSTDAAVFDWTLEHAVEVVVNYSWSVGEAPAAGEADANSVTIRFPIMVVDSIQYGTCSEEVAQWIENFNIVDWELLSGESQIARMADAGAAGENEVGGSNTVRSTFSDRSATLSSLQSLSQQDQRRSFRLSLDPEAAVGLTAAVGATPTAPAPSSPTLSIAASSITTYSTTSPSLPLPEQSEQQKNNAALAYNSTTPLDTHVRVAPPRGSSFHQSLLSKHRPHGSTNPASHFHTVTSGNRGDDSGGASSQYDLHNQSSATGTPPTRRLTSHHNPDTDATTAKSTMKASSLSDRYDLSAGQLARTATIVTVITRANGTMTEPSRADTAVAAPPRPPDRFQIVVDGGGENGWDQYSDYLANAVERLKKDAPAYPSTPRSDAISLEPTSVHRSSDAREKELIVSSNGGGSFLSGVLPSSSGVVEEGPSPWNFLPSQAATSSPSRTITTAFGGLPVFTSVPIYLNLDDDSASVAPSVPAPHRTLPLRRFQEATVKTFPEVPLAPAATVKIPLFAPVDLFSEKPPTIETFPQTQAPSLPPPSPPLSPTDSERARGPPNGATTDMTQDSNVGGSGFEARQVASRRATFRAIPLFTPTPFLSRGATSLLDDFYFRVPELPPSSNNGPSTTVTSTPDNTGKTPQNLMPTPAPSTPMAPPRTTSHRPSPLLAGSSHPSSPAVAASPSPSSFSPSAERTPPWTQHTRSSSFPTQPHHSNYHSTSYPAEQQLHGQLIPTMSGPAQQSSMQRPSVPRASPTPTTSTAAGSTATGSSSSRSQSLAWTVQARAAEYWAAVSARPPPLPTPTFPAPTPVSAAAEMKTPNAAPPSFSELFTPPTSSFNATTSPPQQEPHHTHTHTHTHDDDVGLPPAVAIEAYMAVLPGDSIVVRNRFFGGWLGGRCLGVSRAGEAVRSGYA